MRHSRDKKLPSMSIKDHCAVFGYTRQAYYKYSPRDQKQDDALIRKLIELVESKRKKCPTAGCRYIYERYGNDLGIGRDKAILLMSELGYSLRRPKKYVRTTYSGTRPFSNLLQGLVLTDINQVWQCDMTYYLHGKEVAYLIFITDVYSQNIIGYGAYPTAHAHWFNQVLLKAVKKRKGNKLEGLIHHSDGGKQYESGQYKQTCLKYGILQSMCKYSWENPYAEKTNDLIKNGYLNKWKPKDLEALKVCLAKAVIDHNANRPKKALGGKTPEEFESLLQIPDFRDQRMELELKPRSPEQIRLREII